MKYRNWKTGAVIELRSELKGGDWEAVKDRPPAPAAKKSRRKKEAAK